MTDPLRGRVAVVTGANHGIGAATAALLADRGAAVVATYFRVDEVGEQAGTPASYGQQRARTAQDVVAAIRTAGGRAIALEADLVDPAAPGRIFDAAEAEFGSVEICLTPAKEGVGFARSLHSTTRVRGGRTASSPARRTRSGDDRIRSLSSPSRTTSRSM